MNAQNQIIALDLDGTLLRSDKTVSDRTLKTIAQCKQKGMRFVIATARPPRNVALMLPKALHDDPWICYNGAEIRIQNKIFHQNAIEPEVARTVIEHIQAQLPHCTLTIEIDNHLYSSGPLKYDIEYTITNLLDIATKPAAKILFDIPPDTDPKPALNALPKSCHAIITDQGTLVQIAHHTVSKSNALKVLLDHWHTTFDQVIAFGDDVNDIDILTVSKMGIAMGNAVPQLKKVANRETATNDEDGVAKILEELL